MPKTDHEITLTINGTAYEVFFEREWEIEPLKDGLHEVWNDEARGIKVNGIRTGYFVDGFRRQVLEAVDKWLEANEPQVIDNRY